MTSPKVRRVDFSPDEYIAGVGAQLTAEEQGLYWMICALIMSEGGPVRYNARRFARLVCGRPARVDKIIADLVAAEKLERIGDQVFQKRAQSEVETARNRIETARENGSKGGRPRKIIERNQSEAKADGSFSENLTTNHQPSKKEESGNAPASPTPAERPRRSSRISSDWTPGDEGARYAIEHGLDPSKTLENFRDYWLSAPGARGVKADWSATWRTWCRKEAERNGAQSGGGGRGMRSGPKGVVGAVLEVAASLRAREAAARPVAGDLEEVDL